LDNPWAGGRKGIDILAEIVRRMDTIHSRNLIKNLQRSEPRIAAELRKRVFSFEDLVFADSRGLTRLLKSISLRDLALALKGAPEKLLGHVAHHMSRQAIVDLRDEISVLGPTPISEVEAARSRIIDMARKLMATRELFIQREEEGGWMP
jgi:flagellar motor switch protein FliG